MFDYKEGTNKSYVYEINVQIIMISVIVVVVVHYTLCYPSPSYKCLIAEHVCYITLLFKSTGYVNICIGTHIFFKI